MLQFSFRTGRIGALSRAGLASYVWNQNNISNNIGHLSRESLLTKLQALINSNKIVYLTTASGAGKSSCLKLFKRKLERERDKSKHRNCILIDCKWDANASKLIEKETGWNVVLNQMTSQSPLKDVSKKFIVMLDDAQNKYTGEDNLKLWSALHSNSSDLPSNVQFIIATTHLPSIDLNVCNGHFEILNSQDFVLTSQESTELLTHSIEFLQSDKKDAHIAKLLRDPATQKLILSQCGGFALAVTQTVNAINEHFSPANNTNNKTMSSKKEYIYHYLLSTEILSHYKYCFRFPSGKITVSNESKKLLLDCVLDGYALQSTVSDRNRDKSIELLIRQGVLYKTFVGDQNSSSDSDSGSNSSKEQYVLHFTSPIAERYICEMVVFPRTAANRSLPHEITPSRLVTLAVEAMSTSELQQHCADNLNNNSIGSGDDALLESIWQRNFYLALKRVTPSCSKLNTTNIISQILSDNIEIESSAVYWINSYNKANNTTIGMETRLCSLDNNNKRNNSQQIKRQYSAFEPGGRYREYKPNDHTVVTFCVTDVVDPMEFSNTASGDSIAGTDKNVTVLIQRDLFDKCWIKYGGSDTEPHAETYVSSATVVEVTLKGL